MEAVTRVLKVDGIPYEVFADDYEVNVMIVEGVKLQQERERIDARIDEIKKELKPYAEEALRIAGKKEALLSSVGGALCKVALRSVWRVEPRHARTLKKLLGKAEYDLMIREIIQYKPTDALRRVCSDGDYPQADEIRELVTVETAGPYMKFTGLE